MRIRRIYKLLFLILVLIVIAAIVECNQQPSNNIDNPQPSIYYWRTTFKLTDKEKEFIKTHHIKKMYMRFFDVVTDGNMTVPNATMEFYDKATNGLDIIPVVFITNDCLKYNINGVAEKIVKRISKMCKTNNIPQPEEIQIDCDYTAESRKIYFNLLKQLRFYMNKTHIKRLSTTIRLHQLSMPSPKEYVDYGVLMMYNTGDVKNYYCKNPILYINDIKPYLRYLKDYDLPLCAAYPDFGWQLLFRGKKFKAILHCENLNDSTVYRRITKNKYVLISSRDLSSFIGTESFCENVNVGDSVFVRECTANEILDVKKVINKKRSKINQQVILYDLNEENINRYRKTDYEKIFNH